MKNVLFWTYLFNSVLLIVHEIDSAYWKEWDLFKIKGGISGFLLIHIPLIFILLYGLISIKENLLLGLYISVLVSAGGIFAFIIHMYFIKKGKPEFNTFISKIILLSIFILSIFQIYITCSFLLGFIN